MTKTKAIKLHCFDCACESNKEVTLCPVFDCPLWPFRTGNAAGSIAYKNRVQIALSNHGSEIEAAHRQFLSDSCGNSSKKRASVAKKSPRPIVGAGEAAIGPKSGPNTRI